MLSIMLRLLLLLLLFLTLNLGTLENGALCSAQTTVQPQEESSIPACSFYDRATTDFKEISSPGFPHYYDKNLHCEWTIEAVDEPYLIHIKILAFSTLFGDTLSFIEDGRTRSTFSNRIPNVRSSPHEQNYFSETRKVKIVFRASSGFSDVGFLLLYKLTELYNASSTTPSPVENGTLAPERCITQSFIANNVGGVFSSSGFPLHYDNNQECKWAVIARDKPYRIELTITTFSTDISDTLTIEEGLERRELSGHISELRDYPYAYTYVSDTVIVLLRFKTDERFSGIGFSVKYKLASSTSTSSLREVQRTTETTTSAKLQTESSTLTSSLREVQRTTETTTSAKLQTATTTENYNNPAKTTAAYGNATMQYYDIRIYINSPTNQFPNYTIPGKYSFQYITSPGFPFSYAPNLDIEWTIDAIVKSLRIQLVFTAFCTSLNDTVSIIENSFTYRTFSGLIPELRSSPFTYTYISVSSLVTVKFHSDEKYTGVGFFMLYKLARDDLQGRNSTQPPSPTSRSFTTFGANEKLTTPQARRTRRVKATICEGDTKTLECPEGQEISVRSGFYGRDDRKTCPSDEVKTLSCATSGSMEVIQEMCNGKRTCMVQANNYVFGDPCPGTHKFVKVLYVCRAPPKRKTVVICEHDMKTLSCPLGRVISIKQAFYGRDNKITCPDKHIETTSCSSIGAERSIKENCNGKTSCRVEASNSMFGDPCPGTAKYVKIVHLCNDDKPSGLGDY